jgi:hypothetical protein
MERKRESSGGAVNRKERKGKERKGKDGNKKKMRVRH